MHGTTKRDFLFEFVWRGSDRAIRGKWNIYRVNNEVYIFMDGKTGNEYKVKSWKNEIRRLTGGEVNYR